MGSQRTLMDAAREEPDLEKTAAAVRRCAGTVLCLMIWARFFGGACAEAAVTERPNILFLITDQQTISALGCAGNPDVRTPNLDRLAARGVRFTKSYVAHPLCVPSRASLFSSRIPHELGIYGNTMDAVLAEKGVPTLGGLFLAAGYETAYAGKWHVHDAFPAYEKRKNTIPGFTVLPMGGQDPRKGDKRKDQKSPQCDPFIAEAAVKFLRAPHSQPFLLTVSLLNPHDICEFSSFEGFREILPEDPALLPPLRGNVREDGKLPGALAEERRHAREWTDLQWRQYLWVYYRLVEASDRLLGQVLDALEESGLSSQTLVLFTSDHGEMLGAHQMVTKEKLYEESVAVPLILSVPGASPAVDRDHLVSGLDVMPTLLDYAGIPAPASLEGKSLRPLLERRVTPWREFVAAETMEPEARMIRTARYKYIRYATGADAEQLFDEQADPGEVRNLVGDAAVAGELERHRRLLGEWMQSTRDEFGTGPARLVEIKRREAARSNAPGKAGETPPVGASQKSAADPVEGDDLALPAGWERRDRNRDGVLSREEYLAGQRDAAAAVKRFQRWDTSGDGFLSRDEFMKGTHK